MFFSQGHQGSYPADMPVEQITYEFFASAYNFTEEQTNGLSLDALEWWPVIRAGKSKAQDIQRAQDERMAKNNARR